jgi:hypothetical protein
MRPSHAHVHARTRTRAQELAIEIQHPSLDQYIIVPDTPDEKVPWAAQPRTGTRTELLSSLTPTVRARGGARTRGGCVRRLQVDWGIALSRTVDCLTELQRRRDLMHAQARVRVRVCACACACARTCLRSSAFPVSGHPHVVRVRVRSVRMPMCGLCARELLLAVGVRACVRACARFTVAMRAECIDGERKGGQGRGRPRPRRRRRG